MPSDAANALWKALCMEADAHPRRTGRKIRQRSSDVLKAKIEETFGLNSVQVWANKGYWAQAQQDCYRWEFTGFLQCNDPSCTRFQCISVTGGSYDTMTLCAQKRMKLSWLVGRVDGEICAERSV